MSRIDVPFSIPTIICSMSHDVSFCRHTVSCHQLMRLPRSRSMITALQLCRNWCCRIRCIFYLLVEFALRSCFADWTNLSKPNYEQHYGYSSKTSNPINQFHSGNWLNGANQTNQTKPKSNQIDLIQRYYNNNNDNNNQHPKI